MLFCPNLRQTQASFEFITGRLRLVLIDSRSGQFVSQRRVFGPPDLTFRDQSKQLSAIVITASKRVLAILVTRSSWGVWQLALSNVLIFRLNCCSNTRSESDDQRPMQQFCTAHLIRICSNMSQI